MIKTIQPCDIDTVTSIYNHYIANSIISFEEADLSRTEMQGRVDSVLSSGFPWLVAIQDGEVIGYAYAAQWKPRSAYRYSAEITVYLSHTNTSTGWGTKLYEALFIELRNKSIHTVIGGIALPNPGSVALHEKFGMKQVAHYKDVGYKFEQWIDVGYWQTELNVE